MGKDGAMRLRRVLFAVALGLVPALLSIPSAHALSFGGWEDLGGVSPGRPAVASWGKHRIDAFVVGTDHGLWHTWYDGTPTWTQGFESLGAPAAGLTDDGPAAVSWASGRIDVFAVQAVTRSLVHKWYDNGAWSDWEVLGGVVEASPAVASWAAGHLDVFATGTGGTVWQKTFDSGAWTGWRQLPGLVADSAPAAVSWGAGRIDLFVTDATGALIHGWFDGGRWELGENLGGVVETDPAVSSWGPGHLDVFVTGTTGDIYSKTYDGGWGTFDSLDRPAPPEPDVSLQPAAVSWGPGRIDLFAVDGDGHLDHRVNLEALFNGNL